MITIQRFDGQSLCLGLRNVSPVTYGGITIKNKLLDGSMHIQTIGDPIKYKTFMALANGSHVTMLNLMEARGEPLKLIEDDKYYVGLIDAPIKWDRVSSWYGDKTKERHKGDIKIAIQSEGVI